MAHLIRFYRRTRPAGPGWRRVAAAAGEPAPARLGPHALRWAAGCGAVYLTLTATHQALFGAPAWAALLFTCALALGVWLARTLSRDAEGGTHPDPKGTTSRSA